MKIISFLVLAAVSTASSWAASVLVTGDFFDLSRIGHFYTGLGDNATVSNSSLDTLDLTGISLLWAVQPAQAYTTAELRTLQEYVAGGGRIAFMGEHGFYRPSENLRINAAISALGGHIAIVNLAPDVDLHVASIDNGQILSDPLTAGVDRFEYACFAPLLLSGSARELMHGDDDPTQVMMAYEAIGAGSIFVLADENGWDGEPAGWPSGVDNARLFANLVDVGLLGAGGAVPEPSTYALFGASGLLGLIVLRRIRVR